MAKKPIKVTEVVLIWLRIKSRKKKKEEENKKET